MTDLEVVNRALTFIGVAPIGSLNDNTQTARVMAALLPDTKRVVLNEFPWSFAMRIDPLVASSSPAPAGYSYAFEYPAGALNVQRVYDATGFRGVAEYRVIGNVIGANVPSGTVEYTAFVEDVSSWPRQIAECLTTRLASDAATALTGSMQVSMGLLEKYMTLARVASQTSVVEENVPPARVTDYVQARK